MKSFVLSFEGAVATDASSGLLLLLMIDRGSIPMKRPIRTNTMEPNPPPISDGPSRIPLRSSTFVLRRPPFQSIGTSAVWVATKVPVSVLPKPEPLLEILLSISRNYSPLLLPFSSDGV
jgi:hypothetical protein